MSLIPANPTISLTDTQDEKAIGIWQDSFGRLLKNRMAVVSLVVVGIMFFLAIFGPYLTPYDYLAQNLKIRSQPPTSAHWLGTDYLGRDVLSRVIYGARTATLVSLFVVLLSSVIGIVIGSVSGYFGGKLDFFLMWFTDLNMAFPNLVLGVVLAVSLRPPVSSRCSSRALVALPRLPFGLRAERRWRRENGGSGLRGLDRWGSRGPVRAGWIQARDCRGRGTETGLVRVRAF